MVRVEKGCLRRSHLSLCLELHTKCPVKQLGQESPLSAVRSSGQERKARAGTLTVVILAVLHGGKSYGFLALHKALRA